MQLGIGHLGLFFGENGHLTVTSLLMLVMVTMWPALLVEEVVGEKASSSPPLLITLLPKLSILELWAFSGLT